MTEPEVQAWRRAKRAELLRARGALSHEQHERNSRAVMDRLLSEFAGFAAGVVGAYSPFRGEIDPGPFLQRVFARGGAAALPVVVSRDLPLVFRLWEPGDAMELGAMGIPHPARDRRVGPDVLLVPLVGFDERGYRLGYGGGYYDRTLAAAHKKPVTIGIGFELARLGTIHPQQYDVPLDFIVTEDRVFGSGKADPSLREG